LSHQAAAEIMLFREAKSAVQIVHDWTVVHGIMLAMSRALRRAAEAANRQRPKKITERRMRPPPGPDVFEQLLASALESRPAPVQCAEGEVQCPTCGQVFKKIELLRLVIYEPESEPGPATVVTKGLLCVEASCMQPIWIDIDPPPLVDGAAQG